MPLLNTPKSRPTAADGAHRVRTVLSQSLTQIHQSLDAVRHIVERHGRNDIERALGADAKELQTTYNTLRKCIQTLDATRQVDDLPG